MRREPGPDVDLTSVVDHLHEGLQVIGPDFRYRYLNAAAAGQGKREASELIGLTMAEAYPGIEGTAMFGHLRRIMAEGGTCSLENEFTYPDGKRGWFDLRMMRVSEGVVILSVDVTAKKRTEVALRRAQKMEAVGRLASGIAHDFNNLLTVIQSYGYFVESQLEEGHPVKEDAAAVLHAAERAAELTRKLLAFSRERAPVVVPVHVNAALHDVGRLLERVLGDGIVVEIAGDPSDPKAAVDPTAFEQIVMNLALNARDAMPGGGTLRFDVSLLSLDEEWVVERDDRLAPGDYVCVSVSDTGHGMEPEVLENVFEPFFTTKGDEAGTGLGLATCWGLCRQASGTISAYSEPGRGTTFRVYLPLAQAEREPAPPRGADPTGRPAPSETVLVVDDKEDVRKLTARILREAGYKVLAAASGGEALLLLEDVGDRVQLLLSDVVMPRMSGHDLAARVRERFPAMPVLLMSGFTPRSVDRLRAQEKLMLLPKPFSPRQLVDAVGSCFGHGGH